MTYVQLQIRLDSRENWSCHVEGLSMAARHEIKDSLPCKEFSEFKEALQQMRAVDDKIIYELNTSVPTLSFADQVSAREQCKGLYEQLKLVYSTRSRAIQSCIDETKERVRELREQRESDPALSKELRKQQTKLRLMQTELGVEDVVKERSIKVFRERCWKAYKPPDLQ